MVNMLYYTNLHGVAFTQRIKLTPSQLNQLRDRLEELVNTGRLKGWGFGLSPTLNFTQAMDAIDTEATDPMFLPKT